MTYKYGHQYPGKSLTEAKCLMIQQKLNNSVKQSITWKHLIYKISTNIRFMCQCFIYKIRK